MFRLTINSRRINLAEIFIILRAQDSSPGRNCLEGYGKTLVILTL